MKYRSPAPQSGQLATAIVVAALMLAGPATATDQPHSQSCAAALGGQDTARPDPARLDPSRVGWSEIRMTASKLFMTANARLALQTISGEAAAARMAPIVADGFTPLKPGKAVLELTYDAGGVGRQSSLTLLMDPCSGAALQRSQHDQKGRFRWRVYRFGHEGAYQRTRWPASDAEQNLPPARWTRTSEGLRAYPLAPGTRAVIEPTGLLYVIAAAALYEPGDQLDVLIFRRHDTQTVRIDVLPPREVSVRYDELRPTGTVRHNAKVLPLRLSLRGLPVPGGDPDDDDLELLGLRGNLELLLDPATRAPLELSGDVKILGKVTLRLTAVRPLQSGAIE